MVVSEQKQLQHADCEKEANAGIHKSKLEALSVESNKRDIADWLQRITEGAFVSFSSC